MKVAMLQMTPDLYRAALALGTMMLAGQIVEDEPAVAATSCSPPTVMTDSGYSGGPVYKDTSARGIITGECGAPRCVAI